MNKFWFGYKCIISRKNSNQKQERINLFFSQFYKKCNLGNLVVGFDLLNKNTLEFKKRIFFNNNTPDYSTCILGYYHRKHRFLY